MKMICHQIITNNSIRAFWTENRIDIHKREIEFDAVFLDNFINSFWCSDRSASSSFAYVNKESAVLICPFDNSSFAFSNISFAGG